MDAIARIELYDNLFYAFAGIAAVSLVLAIFFFIRFDIPGIYAIMTGKQRKRTIQEMEQRNHETGKLRFNYPMTHGANTGKRSRTERTGGTGKMAKPNPATAVPTPPAPRPAPNPPEKPRRPKPQPAPQSIERPETEVLTRAAAETVILKQETPHTEELDRTMVLKPSQVEFDFRVTESTLEIHTQELI